MKTRAEIEQAIEPIIRECLRTFGDYSPSEITSEDFARSIVGQLRFDVRRVSLLVWLAQSVAGNELSGNCLELGCGYGYLLFPMAIFNPEVRWTAVEHPDRSYFNRHQFHEAMRSHNCHLVGVDFVRGALPFRDNYFSVVTFSETLEHLPVERLNFVLSEIRRVLRRGGLLIASSPNQASLENRVRLLKGGSILDLPDHIAVAKGTFGHIRLYTPAEAVVLMSRLGLSVERVVLESNNSVYRGRSSKSVRRRLYRLYEIVEQKLGFLRRFGDTWYMVFRKG
jgi:SAM-dependent methyltransferase